MPKLEKLHKVVGGAWPPSTEAITFASVWELDDGTFVALTGFTDPMHAGSDAGCGLAYGSLELAVERAQRKVNEQAVLNRQQQPVYVDATCSN